MNTNKKYIDFNIDLAQVISIDDCDKALDLVDKVSSVNISCGLHAGNPLVIKEAVQHCKFKEKVIGAHIGLPESTKNPLSLSDSEIEAIVLYQLGALSAFAKSESLNVEFVRPHGEMYKLMSLDLEFSTKVANAVKKFSEWLVLYGASGNVLKETADRCKINIAQELLIDMPYLKVDAIDYTAERIVENGKLLIRLRRLANLSELELVNGEFVKVDFDTIHFSSSAVNASELLSEANNIFQPRPVNYNNVVESGWV